MAKLDGNIVTVEQGDTLSQIANTYKDKIKGDTNAARVNTLVSINNIANKDLIYVGQKIKLSGTAGGSTATNSNTATVKQFGEVSNSEGTLFATWDWSKSNTENYEVIWKYDTGNSVWFIGNEGPVDHKQSTYGIPANAKRVSFNVKPISKKYTKNNKETSYWTANWSSTKIFDVSKDSAPVTPSTPNQPTIEDFKLTVTIDGVDPNALHAEGIQFQIVKDNASSFKTGKATIKTNHASYSCTVTAGGEYKVRCRSYKGDRYSAWSAYTTNVPAPPAASAGIGVLKRKTKDEVYIDWHDVKGATGYEVEYTTEKRYFDSGSDQVKTVTVDTGYTFIGGLVEGYEYFFRVRAKIDDSDWSKWTGIKSIVIAAEPAAPTTWSSTTSAITGEEVTLYWVHNSQDESSMTQAQIEIKIDGVKISPNGDDTPCTVNKPGGYRLIKLPVGYTLEVIETFEDVYANGSFVESNAKTSNYLKMNPSYGSKIEWRVTTRGVSTTWSEWSVVRTVEVYDKPSLSLSLHKNYGDTGDMLEVVEQFPFYVYGLPGPAEQAPIGYHLAIKSNEYYETVDRLGNAKIVNAGDTIYSEYKDISNSVLWVQMSASNVDLENNISYTVTCTVSMNSGLTAENSCDFTVSWTETECQPNAEITFDKDSVVTHIRPYCEDIKILMREVSYNSSTGKYSTTNSLLLEEPVSSWPVYNRNSEVYTTTGEQVFAYESEGGTTTYYCFKEEALMVGNIRLSVYRREFDGTFTELATNIPNNNTFITDPHPALDYARYRIVATSTETGAVSYYDVPGYPIGEVAAIIQWDEDWSEFDVVDGVDDAPDQPLWSGSLLKLPYNVDVSDNHSPDVSLIEYIGRKHPVSYYGTQLGESSSWSMEIPKDDKETLYALRRLAVWMGDVYVREPSGSGYWANITVSFSQTHCEVTIPVTLNITRVEGGI